ncbi:response regulator transcription factor [Subsaximicrobium wynnwilliamsii]|uniref:Response regulator transcription factor n=1 Tax=Subsaximicrobium wynnwilliamsii TaxID=291179 RepID=A0A5C6ZI17_9FLAO|nr:LytTR family DNA-binding domain-containing protein [Subsaximicrobium wynnwilliamsii]TXD84204.1 response regulator transcription factor [Subsaximicrobium wynnwilliamsii]TXD89825.1 response regulator transcription factor [Subsaximicrobium wynnwilliamsii]TXE03916.1 response regulator transcription factor [Subsaximicrobium wynnwilliamsii]
MSTQTKPIACLIVDDEPAARDIIAMHLSQIENIRVIAQCESAVEAFQHIQRQNIDLIFLDINMPEVSGIAFAKSINSSIQVIFTTAYRDYAVEGFELKAVDYLLKPISFERLKKAVQRYFEIQEQASPKIQESENASEFMFVRADRKMLKIDFEAIFYIESIGDYLKIHLASKTIVTRETMTVVEAKLPNAHFMRIHRSFIINIPKLQSFTSEHITILNSALPISRSYKKSVLNYLEKF